MRNLQNIRLTVFGLVLILIAGVKIFAADGDVDNSFGFGLTRHETGIVYAGVRQPDGKVIVGGAFRVANGLYYHGLARFNANGTIDTGFNIGNGQVIGGVVSAVALQADGKILVGGSFHDWDQPDFPQTREPRGYLVRLNADGSIDESFIGFGSEAGPNFWVNNIVVQPDGNILVSGSFWMFGNTPVKQLIRLNPAGELDTVFNANLGTGFSGSSTGSPVHAIALQTNGQILIGGEFSAVNSISANRLARLNSDGTLDTNFAANIGTGALGGAAVEALAVQPADGKILLGGSFEEFNGTVRHLMARINQDGTLDTTFDSVAGNNGAIQAFAIQPDGQIIVSGPNGSFTDGKNSRPAIARLNAEDGSLDLTFDPGTGTSATNLEVLLLEPADGSVYVGGNFFAFNDTPRLALTRLNGDGSLNVNFKPIIGHQANVNVLAVQADDKVLVGGDFHGAGNLMSPKIARYNAAGSVDTSFNAFSPGYIDGEVKAIAVQTDGKILIGGSFTYFGGVNKAGIARLNADGSRDTTFNGETTGNVNSIVIQEDGKIVIGGSFFAVNGELGHFGIVRLNADGTTDATFASNGCGVNCSIEKILLQPDDKILVGGTFLQFNGFKNIENMTRLNADGTLDNSFNLNLGSGFDSTVQDIATQTDGKILVTGWFGTVNGANSSRIVRLNANGTIDGSFSVGAGLDWIGLGLAIQPNGQIIVVGHFGGYQGQVRQKIVRINPNGMLDTTFAQQEDPQITLNDVVLDSHGKVIVGGYFNKYQNARRYGIARLNNDGLNPTWGEDSEITIPSTNLDPNSNIGSAVAIDGDTAVVGDFSENILQGAVYIYVRNGTNWTLQQKLTASDGEQLDQFGISVAIDGDTVIIGAPANESQGAAYIFVRNGTTWTQQQKLTAIDGENFDNFGESVSIKNNTAVVGSPQDNVGGNEVQGSVRVFERTGTNWVLAGTLTALDGAAGDRFGWSVSISGSRIIIGAPDDNIGGNQNQGSAYIFVNIAFQWQQQQKLTASDGGANDRFGRSVSIDGDYAAIGSMNSVYIFVGNAVEWSEQQRIIPLDSCGTGESVSISGNRVVAGCPYDEVVTGQFPGGPGNRNAGAAYIFVRNGMTWTQEAKFRGLDTRGGDYFGAAVAISGNTVIVGAPDAFWNGGPFGAAYIFVLNGSNWFQQKKLIIETEVPSALFGGSVAIHANTAVIGASGVNNNRGAAFIYVKNGTSWTLQATLLAPDGESFDQFGYSVAIAFNKVIIGAPGDDSDKGAAYIFERDVGGTNWTFVRKLTDPEGESADYFGTSVGIEQSLGPYFIAGSPGDTVNGISNKGSATIFTTSGDPFPKLTASDGQEADGFGTSVTFRGSISSNLGTVIIGSPSNGVSGNQGSAYVFDYLCPGTGCNWVESSRLFALDSTGNNQFGTSVATNGNILVIGAIGDNSSKGAAYIFGSFGEFDNVGTERAKLTAFDGLPNDRFGQSVAISGDIVVVGAPFDDIGSNSDQGSAYVFTQGQTINDWNFRQKLISNNSAADLYGFSVGVSGGNILVGALNVDIFPSLTERRRQSANLVGTDQGEVTFYGVRFLVPTSAEVSLGGRVLTSNRQGISRTLVTLTKQNGETRAVLTNSFGYYRFDDLPVGETYIISVNNKKYQFNPSSQLVTLKDNVTDINFIGETDQN